MHKIILFNITFFIQTMNVAYAMKTTNNLVWNIAVAFKITIPNRGRRGKYLRTIMEFNNDAILKIVENLIVGIKQFL